MQELVPVNTRMLADADAVFFAGWLPRARTMYEHVVEHALDQGNRGLEAAARAMLARCLLRRRDPAGAADQLERARAVLPEDRAIEARIRAAEIRLHARLSSGSTLLGHMNDYYEWSANHSDPCAFDAAILLADECTGDERIHWYRRAVDHGRVSGPSARLGSTCHALAAALESQNKLSDALDAYKTALEIHERLGDRRQIIVSHWAIGVIAARTEDWLMAQEHLQAAADAAVGKPECEDLLALALADLAGVHQEWGDDIEARRLLLQALAIGREIALAQSWPERWDAMLAHAKRLEI